VETLLSEETNQLIVKITVEKESSAANIDLDIAATMLKLTSENYELHHKFEKEVDPDNLKCKFNKKAHTLTLTLALI